MPQTLPQTKPQPPQPAAARIEQPDRRSLVGLHALSIRQPWAELILRGRKAIEFRSRPTNIRGRVLIYASLGRGDWLDDHLAEIGHGFAPGEIAELPRGLIVGSVVIDDCRPLRGAIEFAWRLSSPVRFRRPIAVPTGRQPTPIFWFPFPIPRPRK